MLKGKMPADGVNATLAPDLREFMALFVIGSALTVAVFFLPLWLLPDKPFTTFLFLSFPAISLTSVTSSAWPGTGY